MVAYRRQDAKDWARENMRGIWAAALTPFRADMSIDETALRSNLRHWFSDLGVDGVFIARKHDARERGDRGGGQITLRGGRNQVCQTPFRR